MMHLVVIECKVRIISAVAGCLCAKALHCRPFSAGLIISLLDYVYRSERIWIIVFIPSFDGYKIATSSARKHQPSTAMYRKVYIYARLLHIMFSNSEIQYIISSKSIGFPLSLIIISSIQPWQRSIKMRCQSLAILTSTLAFVSALPSQTIKPDWSSNPNGNIMITCKLYRTIEIKV